MSAADPAGEQTLKAVRDGTVKVGDPVSVTVERARQDDDASKRDPHLVEPLRRDRARSVAANRVEQAEQVVVGWYHAAHDERLPMAGRAVLNVPAGDYPVVAERQGDRVARLGVDLLGTVVSKGDRTDLNIGADRAVRRPVTEEQFVELAGHDRSAFRLERAMAAIAGGRVELTRDASGKLQQIARARGTLGVTYNGPIVRVSGNDLVQQLSDGELVRHERRALEQKAMVGQRVAIAYDDRAKAQVQRIGRGHEHSLSHAGGASAQKLQ
jgi:hypothetical protein